MGPLRHALGWMAVVAAACAGSAPPPSSHLAELVAAEAECERAFVELVSNR